MRYVYILVMYGMEINKNYVYFNKIIQVKLEFNIFIFIYLFVDKLNIWFLLLVINK